MWSVSSFNVAVSLLRSVCVCVCLLSSSGTEKNLRASKVLSDMWPKVESDATKHAALLLW